MTFENNITRGNEVYLSQGTPRVTSVRAIPVAGRDSMLLNLSGHMAPFLRAT